ncbi:MAG: DUF58 domain-containing protein [Alphaproteobacteria bacterium]
MKRERSSDSALTEAKRITLGLPDLLIEARRVAATVLAGWHGRRTAGRGEAFWQFRAFVSGDPANTIDWRRSARDDHVYVREKEWEAVHTIWLWQDRSSSMAFRSSQAMLTKHQRATVLMLALAELLAAAGERVGLLGAGRPILARDAAEKLALRMATSDSAPARPDVTAVRRFSDIVLISDFLDPREELAPTLQALAKTGAQVHLIQITDPAEETFPYSGRTEFRDPENGLRHVVSRAEQYRADYVRELAALRSYLDAYRRRLGWSFIIHHTDRPATEPILQLHARLADRKALQVNQSGSRIA